MKNKIENVLCIKMLRKCYENLAKILPKCCENIAKYCKNIAENIMKIY